MESFTLNLDTQITETVPNIKSRVWQDSKEDEHSEMRGCDVCTNKWTSLGWFHLQYCLTINPFFYHTEKVT